MKRKERSRLPVTIKNQVKNVKNGILEKVASIPLKPEDIGYLPKEAGSKAGIPYITDDFVRRRMDLAFGKENWGIEGITTTDTRYAEIFGRVAVLIRVWWRYKGVKSHTDCWGEADIETYKDRSGRTRMSNEPHKSAMTDALKKAIGDHKGLASAIYDGKIPRKSIVQDENSAEKKMLSIDDSTGEITIEEIK